MERASPRGGAVLVEGLNHAGALHDVAGILKRCAEMPKAWGTLAASFGIAGLSNVMNNLPSGLLAGGALQTVSVPPHIRDAVLIGVDLGPNLSVTGSLATVLWLIALRREGERITGAAFLKWDCWLCRRRCFLRLWPAVAVLSH